MMEVFLSAFISLFVVIDPPGTAPIFGSLTTSANTQQRRSMAVRAVLVSTGILLAFALAGEAFLRKLGISLEAFRIAGGIMLFFIAMDMVFETRMRRREERAEKIKDKPEFEDVAIFPMAMPMIAGPGSIATIMLLVAKASGTQETVIVIGALLLNLVLVLIGMLAVGPIMRLFGGQVEVVISRLLGVILAALAVQFVLDGLSESIL